MSISIYFLSGPRSEIVNYRIYFTMRSGRNELHNELLYELHNELHNQSSRYSTRLFSSGDCLTSWGVCLIKSCWITRSSQSQDQVQSCWITRLVQQNLVRRSPDDYEVLLKSCWITDGILPPSSTHLFLYLLRVQQFITITVQLPSCQIGSINCIK